MEKIIKFLPVFVALALAGCATESNRVMTEPEQPVLAGSWLVEDIDQGGVIDFAQVTMQFDEPGRIAGSTGCNRYSGSLVTDDKTFVASKVASTRRACAPAVAGQEQRFLAALNDAVRYEIESDTWLLVYDAADRPRLKLTQK